MESHDTTEVTEAPETGAEAPQEPQYLTEDALDTRMQELRSDIVPMLESLRQPSEPEPEEADEFAELFAQDYGDQLGEQAQGLDPDQLRSAFQKVVQDTVGPQREELREWRLDREAAELEGRFPDLQKPEVAREIVGQAQAVAQAFGNPEMARQPKFIELIYKASMADQRAAQETPAGSQGGIELESAGGAAPTSEEDAQNRILAAYQKQSAPDFFG